MLKKRKKHIIKNKLEFVKQGIRPEKYIKGKSGFAYETRCKLILKNIFPQHRYEFIDEPWYIYKECNTKKTRACEPDCIMINELDKEVYIFEIKEWNYIEGKNDILNLYNSIIKYVYPNYKIYGFVLSKKFGKPLSQFDLQQMYYRVP